VGPDLLRDKKTDALARLIRAGRNHHLARLLVVGCGSGVEAAVLARELKVEVVGIDLETEFDATAALRADLRWGDATALEFADRSFDFVFSFHALEHIPDYDKALAEMRRVVGPGGGYCVGTPNRDRLVGYLGSKTATAREKLRWNLADWHARLTGQFSNAAGAHAGFTAEELEHALRQHFRTVQNISRPYYYELYPRKSGLIRFLGNSGLERYLFPAVYFFGEA
jgi:ubiquinone/menaquinone biosynthesis C-methylase UbiE